MSLVSQNLYLPPLAPPPVLSQDPTQGLEHLALSHFARSLAPAVSPSRDASSGSSASTSSAPAAPTPPAPGLKDPIGSDVLVFDSFIPTISDMINGSVPHGDKTSYISANSSQSGEVEVYTMQAPGIEDWAGVLSAVADYESPPEVINMSLGLNPAANFLFDFDYLKLDFEALHGSDHSLWSETTKADYKAEVQALVDSSAKAFKDDFATVALDIKAALEKLVAGGSTVVIAAGNEGEAQQILDELGITPPDQFFDGTYLPDLPPGVVFVGASTGNDSTSPAASFTTPVGAVDVAADGTAVEVSDDGEVGDGTSFSAPQITGLVADMKAIDPDLTPAQIESILAQSATLQEGEEIRLGAGVVDPQKALDLVKQRLEEKPILETVQDNFQTFASAATGLASDEWIDTFDLKALAADSEASEEVRSAAQYLLDHPDVFAAWEGTEEVGNKADGFLGAHELAIWSVEQQGISTPEFVAVQQLKQHFSQLDSILTEEPAGWFDKDDLYALMNDTTAAPKLRSAAEYVYNNPDLFTELDGAYSKAADGWVNYTDLARWEESQAV